MARGRPRASNASTAKSTPAKRAASPSTPARQSKRINSASTTPRNGIKVTPKKSVYFEHGSDSESELGDTDSDVEQSGYEDEDASATEPDPTSDEYASSEEEDQPSRRRGKGPVTKTPPPSKGKVQSSEGGELWREGVKSHLEPGEEVFIELPKARPAGKTPYKDHTIHPNTLLFLGDLKAHNERAWLKTHDADFRQSERDWKSFVETVGEKLIEVDDTIPELPVKDVIYRIYRDVRFSKDPTPYKPHFSAAWSRTGRKGPYAVYYLQIGKKGGSVFGGGLWMPSADQLAALRQSIDRRAGKLKDVLMLDGVRNSFLDGAPQNQSKVVKAFAKKNKENALKKKPKDYDADHPEIELLKLKNFIIGCPLKDEDVTSPKFMDHVVGLMRDMEPFITYLNSVVMPDDDNNDDDDDDDDDDGDGDEGDNDQEEGPGETESDEDPGPDPDEPEDWEPQ